MGAGPGGGGVRRAHHKYGRRLAPGGDVEEVLWREKLREDASRAEGVAVVRWVWADLRSAASFAPTVARLHRALDRAG
ncbi:hypothetical protein [Pseudonocardia sp. HH130629-09]|uniref:hypothetical protein n=1 Tax=Pseudonocardia sp. HH130629-09 TaxID=1641402 RepID=UPI0011AE1DE1|nr:hypothetical protein [Pseudonocardia sp. HH130629-09]